MKRNIVTFICIIAVAVSMIGCSGKSDKKKEDNVITNKKVSDHLTIYSVYNNPTLKQAIMGFKSTHMGLKIDYEVAMEDYGEDNESDVVRALITRILADDGPDLLLLDHLPRESFVDKGVLMDMSDILMEPYENQELIMNIADNYIDDGHIYFMPMRFFIPLYLMGKDISGHTKSLSDLAAYCQTSDQRLMELHSYKELATMFTYTYWNEIMNEQGIIDQEKLKIFMDNISAIAKKSEAIDGDVEHSDVVTVNIECAKKDGCIPFGNAYKIFCGDVNKILEEHIDTSFTFAYDYFILGGCKGLTKEANGIYTPINDTYVPNGLVGINKNTQNAELAKQFVSYLFSSNIQSLDTYNGQVYDGFPINMKALNNWINYEYDSSCLFDLIDYDGNHRNFQYRMTVEEKREEDKLFCSLTRPVYDNEICMDMIVEGTVDFLTGKKTRDEAVNDIINKVNLYLQE